jgi:hypothetical protein
VPHLAQQRRAAVAPPRCRTEDQATPPWCRSAHQGARDATLQCRLAHGQTPIPGCHRQRAEDAAVAPSRHWQSPLPRPAPSSSPVADPAVGTPGPGPGTKEAPPPATGQERRCHHADLPPPRAAPPVAVRHRTGRGGRVLEQERMTCSHGRRHHMAAAVAGPPTTARSRSGPGATGSGRRGSGAGAPPPPPKGRQGAVAPTSRPGWRAAEKGPRCRRPWGTRGLPAGPSGGGREGRSRWGALARGGRSRCGATRAVGLEMDYQY